MRRKPLAAVLALLSAALVLGGNALLDAGWGVGAALDRRPRAAQPRDRHVGARARARQPRELLRRRHRGGGKLRLPGGRGGRQGQYPRAPAHLLRAESDGEGWLEIEARGGSGVRYRACNAAEAPAAARGALDR